MHTLLLQNCAITNTAEIIILLGLKASLLTETKLLFYFDAI